MTEGRRARARALALLGKPTDVAALVVFRALLGVLVTVSAARFVAYGWVDELFVKPTFAFKYWGFGWVAPLSPAGMHAVFVALAVLGACFAVGLFYRVVAPLLFVLFTYVQLLDVTNWLNHYYLVSLLLFLASFMPLGRALSIDARIDPTKRLDAFPAWCTYLLRFQVGVVYFYAGVAKLGSDWLLHAQPLNIWLSARTSMSLVGGVLDERWAAYLFSWGGFLFDTSIVGFLLWRRSRPFAYALVLFFHGMVGLLFPIGMFPWIMVTAALVFFSPSWPRRIFRKLGIDGPIGPAKDAQAPRRAWLALALAYCAIQVAVPLRHFAYPGSVLWHEQGMRFSWRVMVREKNGSLTYVVRSPRAQRTWYVEPRRYVTDRQEREMAAQPDLVLQLAHHVADDFRRKGYDDVEVRAETMVSLNGRGGAPMIDPDVDLARVHDGLGRAAWILPAPEGPPLHLRPAWNTSARFASRSGS